MNYDRAVIVLFLKNIALFITAIVLYVANIFLCEFLGIDGDAIHGGWIVLFLYYFLRLSADGKL